MENILAIDPQKECQRISNFIETKRNELERDGVIIGLSGGLDSAVTAYLAGQGVEREKINLLYMPDKDSKKSHHKDAKTISHELGIPLDVEEITHILNSIGIYKLLPLDLIPGTTLKGLLTKIGLAVENISQENLIISLFSPKPNSFIAKGNAYATIKHRMRMVHLYYHANIKNLLVVGAANRTELLTGAFSQWGCDQCADVMPIIHLFRSQVESIAAFLNIPEQIRNKPADPDIIPGVDDKEALIGSFHITDQILWMLEHGTPLTDIYTQLDHEAVGRVIDLYERSQFMRETPYSFL